MLFGAPESPRPWSQEEKVTFVCPVPGYDRHFSMLADFGIEMVTVPMNADGPDVPSVEALVRDDPSVKGMWVVPTYANPSGAVCSQEVAAALASMPTAAPDFRIFWDNAYAFHHLTEEEAKSADVLTLAAASGNPNRPLMFASTSKITYAGAGVSVFAASDGEQGVVPPAPRHGVDRSGQGQPPAPRRVLRLGRRRPRAHAPAPRDHRAEVRRGGGGPHGRPWTASAWPSGPGPPAATSSTSTSSTAPPRGSSSWPRRPGIALTPAGASFPYGQDPRDRNIRLAPTFPPLEQVETAMAGVGTCVALAAAEKLAVGV